MAKKVAVTGPVEGPWALPDGWRWQRLSSLLSGFTAGKRPKGGVAGITEGALSIGGEHLRWDGSISSDNPRYIPNEFAEKIHSAKVLPGDVLVVKDGATTGKTAYAGPNLADRFVNEHVFIVRVDPNIAEPRYVFFWLWSQPGHAQIMQDFRGAAQGGIGRTMPEVVLVPLPPRDHQQHIVARIDELFAEIDDGEASLDRARADLTTWRKALLKAAVTGELTADWRAANPSTETGAQLASRILEERAQIASKRLGKRRDKAPEEITAAQQQLLWPAPDGWTWMQLGTFSFVTKLAGFEYTKFVRYGDEGDLRVIKAENAGLHGFKETNYSRVKSASVAELTRSRLYGGELLMVFVGAGTGNVATVPEGEDFFLGPNIGMMRVETNTVAPRFVELFLRSPVGKALATAAMKAVAQPSLSMGTIRQIPVVLPPAAEQAEILRRVEHALTAAADCGTEVRDQQVAAASLRQSILAAAFRGELA